MTDKVIRFSDYERKSKNPDASQPRDLVEADVITLPVIRIERYIDDYKVPEVTYP